MTVAEAFRRLEIAPTKEKRRINQAFAEKTVGCHPEDNPDGFLLLKQAHDMAISYAENRTSDGDIFYQLHPFDEPVHVERTEESSNDLEQVSQTDAFFAENAPPVLSEKEAFIYDNLTHQLHIILLNESYRNNRDLWENSVFRYLWHNLGVAHKDPRGKKPIDDLYAGMILDEITKAPPLPPDILDSIKQNLLRNHTNDAVRKGITGRLDILRTRSLTAGIKSYRGSYPEKMIFGDKPLLEKDGPGCGVYVLGILLALYLFAILKDIPYVLEERAKNIAARQAIEGASREASNQAWQYADPPKLDAKYSFYATQMKAFIYDGTTYCIWYDSLNNQVWIRELGFSYTDQGIIIESKMKIEDFLQSHAWALRVITEIEEDSGYQYLKR